MAITIRTPAKSFVRFSEADYFTHCIYGQVKYCLPIYDPDDYAFQWVLEADSEAEADMLCDLENDLIEIGIVENCGDAYLLQFNEKPERFRISERQVLYNWSHGFPLYDTEIEINQCFKVMITVPLYGITNEFCSNCFERIGNDCFTSVLEYGNDENAFGFNYCSSGVIDSDDEATCEPTIFPFGPVATYQIPYTAQLRAMYGDAPSIQTWIYDSNGDLVNMGITATFDGMPVTLISWDFGGVAQGIIRMS